MENLKLPAYPVQFTNPAGQVIALSNGLTKIELASLMMVPVVATYESFLDMGDETVARHACQLAKAVLEEANK